MNTLEGDRIKLRALEPEDANLLYQWENDPTLWHLGSTLVPFSKHILKKFTESGNDIYADKQLRLMICLKEGQAIGAIDLFDFSPHHQRAGVGILIANEIDRKNGYGSESLDVLINYAFSTLQLNQLYCNVLLDNEDSLQLFQKKGFSISGTKKNWVKIQGEWKDEYLLQLLATERDS